MEANSSLLEQFKENDDLYFKWFEFWLNFHPRKYQRKYLKSCLHNNKVIGIWSRQSGKSTSTAAYLVFRLFIGECSVMITAPTLTHSSELFYKIRNFININPILKKEVVKFTATELILNNNSRAKALPSGTEGKSIRGFTADIVVEEEAGIIDDYINNSVIMPMLASKGDEGQVIKIGTPLTKNHFFRSAYNDKSFDLTRVTWKECIEEGQYSEQFVEDQRKNITDIQFLTEYQSEFVEELASMFPTSLLNECMEDYNIFKYL